MRFDKRITFVKETDSYYDPVLGEYIEGVPLEDTHPCNLSRLGVERTNELFGKLDRVITVARLQRPYSKDFDHVMIDEQKYTTRRQSDYRKGVFYLEGASNV